MSDKHVYWVHLVNRHGVDASVFRLAFECDFATVGALRDELGEYGVVNGSRLWIRDDGHGGREVLSRRDFMFGAAGVVTIQPYEWPVHEISA